MEKVKRNCLKNRKNHRWVYATKELRWGVLGFEHRCKYCGAYKW